MPDVLVPSISPNYADFQAQLRRAQAAAEEMGRAINRPFIVDTVTPNAVTTPPLHPAASYGVGVSYSEDVPTRAGEFGAGMIIGEAPGKTEVREGRPFVGPSGRLLWAALDLLDVAHYRLTVTNALSYQTLDGDGRNVTPSIDSVTSMENLERIEELVTTFRPRAILLLGRTAQNLIGDAVGRWGARARTGLGRRWTWAYFAWHPAYVLRDRSRHDAWLAQLAGFARMCGAEQIRHRS